MWSMTVESGMVTFEQGKDYTNKKMSIFVSQIQLVEEIKDGTNLRIIGREHPYYFPINFNDVMDSIREAKEG